MSGETQAETRRSQYLLGLSTDAERERLESDFFADDDAFQEMLTAEDDLIDAYARGELSAKESKQFEKRFLTSPLGRERLQFARALAGPQAEQEVAASTWWPGFLGSLAGPGAAYRLGTVMAVVIVAVGFSALLIDRSRMNNELRELRAERARLTEKSEELQRIADVERARSAELTAQIQASNNPPGKPAEEVTHNEGQRRQEPTELLASIPFDISPGSIRGGGGQVLPVPQRARSIVLRLSFERPSLHQEYRAAIETPDGSPVWRNDSFGSRSNVTESNGISLPAIPAGTLPPGDYILLLSGRRSDGSFEPVANYSFRISRK